MKIRTFIPAIIALLVLLSSPFSYMPLCGSKPNGGLACYCCSDTAGKKCTMISCTGCKAKGDFDESRWTPEMILDSFCPIIQTKPVYTETEIFIMPETVYIEVPVNPPNHT
jgi:hypothetical protein